MLDSSIDFKEQMAEARRTQIILGAAQVFVANGYHKATTKQIAKTAGVSEGTIYNYFGNKRDLLLAMVDFIGAETLRTVIAETPPENPRELFAAIIRDRFQLISERGSMMAPLLAEIFNDVELREAVYQRIVLPVTAHMETYVQEHTKADEFRQINPVIVIRSMMGALLLNIALKQSGVDSRYDDISIDNLIEQITSLFLDGLLIE